MKKGLIVKIQKGFTLIELMIVVVIIGILAAIALPTYQDYVIRAQVAEGISLAAGVKVNVAEYYSIHGEVPTDSEALGNWDGASGKYVDSVEIVDGAIVATFGGKEVNSAISGETIRLVPIDSDGTLRFNCFFSGDPKYSPATCPELLA